MNARWGVYTFGITEILIGTITLISIIISLATGVSTKPPAILAFVVATAVISTCLGLGVIQLNKTSYELLVFFAKVIILSKLLIFAGIISLSGALETSVPQSVKNGISILYHSFLILYLRRSQIRDLFAKP